MGYVIILLKLLATTSSFVGLPIGCGYIVFKFLKEDKVAFYWRFLTLLVLLGVAVVLFSKLYDILWI